MEAEGWRKEVILVITSRLALIRSFLNFQPPASSFQPPTSNHKKKSLNPAFKDFFLSLKQYFCLTYDNIMYHIKKL